MSGAEKVFRVIFFAFFSACTGFVVVPICSVLLWLGERGERRKHGDLKPFHGIPGYHSLPPGHYWAG
jgi:hypothetical protein